MSRYMGFAVFLSIFLSLYLLMHFYVYRRIVRYFEVKDCTYLKYAFLVLALSYIAVRLLHHFSRVDIIRYLTCGASLWMGVIFYLFLLFLLSDIVLLLLRIPGHFYQTLLPAKAGYAAAAWAVLLLTLLVTVYGILDARVLRVSRHALVLNKAEMKRSYRIAQISDVHLGVILHKRTLQNIVDLLNAERPDIVVITGDLVDEESNDMADLADTLKQIRAPLGVYAVTGNHEFFAGVENAIRIMRSAGIRVLLDESAVIDNALEIVGAIDPTGEGYGFKRKPLAAIAGDPATKRARVLLQHQPSWYGRNSALGIDLQLSGHTHNGQLFPWRRLVRLFFPKIHGLYDLGGSFLYVSSGTGTWGPPMRVLCPPEIAVFDLAPSGNTGRR